MLKYIIIKETDGAEFAFFTLAPVTHLELALSLQAYRPGRTVVSAGFVTIEPDGRVTTHGRSESLNLGPRRTDADTLTIFTRATASAAQASLNVAPVGRSLGEGP